VARVRSERSEPIYIATKAGRRLDPHVASGYNRENLTSYVERSLKNLKTNVIDLLQLHCPPTNVYYMPETFGVLDDLVQQGKLRYYGVSVEKVEEALKAMEFPNVQTVQIVFNIFRQRPQELFFSEAKRRKVGILARVPLASGLLTGKINQETVFSSDDHRNYNRHGEFFDVGETFSGVDFESGLKAVEQLRPLVPKGMSMAQFALSWILMFDAVSCVIPGAKRPAQAEDNINTCDFPPLTDEMMENIRKIYNLEIRPHVHQRW
jgi:aryl-alcohol dehydrogenase-like predicted oxidoreductase